MNERYAPDPKLTGHLFVTDEEVNELILLIDEEEVDEDILRDVRRKLARWRRKTRQRRRERKVS